MAKRIVARVMNNRMQFRCPACGTRRSIPVQPNVRQKNVRCHKCHTSTCCTLNRRTTPRELASGKAVLFTSEGRHMEVNIHDISMDGGIGLEIPIAAARAHSVTPGSEIHFNCKWNPRLLGTGRFKVINSNGQRVGIKKVHNSHMML